MSVELLAEPTLVLNKYWTPVRVCTVKRALGLLFRGVAQAILPTTYECYDFNSWADLHVAGGEPHIRTVSFSIRVPEVILLRSCDYTSRPKVVFSRRNLFRRDKYTCQYCGRKLPTGELSIDHVVPRMYGGKSTWENCVVACTECNVRKGNRTLKACGMKLLKAPREPRWRPSFAVPLPFKRRESWEQFISKAYWNVELQQ